MNYTVTISISCLLASQKTLIYQISVRPFKILVRPSDLCSDVETPWIIDIIFILD